MTLQDGMRINPFVGPKPFSRADCYRFFGRDAEIYHLFSQVASHRTVLLYAQSGAGKSSLLHAGLIPELEKQDYDVLVGGRLSEPAVAEGWRDNIFAFNLAQGLLRMVDHPVSFTTEPSLVAVLASIPRTFDEDEQTKTRVLILDQFEELFTAHLTHWQEREKLFLQLADAMKAEPDLRILFGMREDYIANMDGLVSLVPEACRARVRLERLRRDNALLAIKEPLPSADLEFAPGVAETLVDNLLILDRKGDAAPAIPVDLTQSGRAEFVEPLHLQLVCFNCVSNLSIESKIITERDLQEFGDVNRALQSFYDVAIAETSRSTGLSENKLRTWFDCDLLTDKGTRDLVFRGDRTTGTMPNRAVDELERLHVIRPEMRGGERWYEISHDQFLRPIQNSNQVPRRRRSLLVRVFWVILFLLFMVVFSGIALHFRHQRNDFRSRLAQATATSEDLETKLKSAVSHREEVRIKIVDTSRDIVAAQKVLDDLNDQIADKNNELSEKKIELTQKQLELDASKKKLLSTYQAKYEAGVEQVVAEEKLSAQRAQTAQTNAVRTKEHDDQEKAKQEQEQLAVKAAAVERASTLPVSVERPTAKLTISVKGSVPIKRADLPPQFYVDGRPYAYAVDNTFFTLNLPPGPHDVCVASPFGTCEGATRRVLLANDRQVYLAVRPVASRGTALYQPFDGDAKSSTGATRVAPASIIANQDAFAQ